MAVKTERFNLRIPPEYCADCIKDALREIGTFKSYDDYNGYFHGTYAYIFQRVDVSVFLKVNKRETLIEAAGATDDVIGTGGSKAIKKLKQALYDRAKQFEDFYTLEDALQLLYEGDKSGAAALTTKAKPSHRGAIFLQQVCNAFLMLNNGEQEEGIRLLLDSLRKQPKKNSGNYKQLAFIAFKQGYFNASASILLEFKNIQTLDDATQDFLLLQLILSQETAAFAQEAMNGFPMNIDRLSIVFQNKEVFTRQDHLFDAAYEAFLEQFNDRIRKDTALDSLEYLIRTSELSLPEYYDTHHAYLRDGEIEDFPSFHSAFMNFMEVIRQSEEAAREILLSKFNLLFLSVVDSLEQIGQIQQSSLTMDGKGVYNELYQNITSTVNQISNAQTFTELETKINLLKNQNDSFKKLDVEYRTLLSNYILNNINKFSRADFDELKTLYKTRLSHDKYSFATEEGLLMASLSKKKKFKRKAIVFTLIALLVSFAIFKISEIDFGPGETPEPIPISFLESGKEIGIVSDHEDYSNMRQGPGTSYPVDRKLTALDSFFVINSDASGWMMIQLADSTLGYVHDSRVDILTEEFYTQILAAFNKESEAINHIKSLERRGISGDFLFIPNYSSLSGTQMYAVFSGKFATESQCKAALRKTKKLQSSAYGVLVSNTSPSSRFDVIIEKTSYFDGMSDRDIKNYASGQLGQFSSLIENEDIDRLTDIFSSTMSIYHNYRDTPLSTIIANSKSRYFNKWIVLQDSVFSVAATRNSKYEFIYNKVYVIQSKSEPDDTRRYLIEGVMKLDERTGKIIELDDTSTERLEEVEFESTEADESEEIEIIEEVEDAEDAEDEIFNFAVVENKPIFPGCENLATEDEKFMCFNQSIMWHIGKKFEFPELARQMGIQGKVYVNFVIEKNGKVSNVTIARGVDKLIDDEAIRVIKLLPKFTPAKQRGKPVRMQYTVPINARLQ
jgi:TonB family protein